MEYVLLSLIILFVGGIFGLGIGFLYAVHVEKKFKGISLQLEQFKTLISSDLVNLKNEVSLMQDFIVKAQTDLDTIVKEYEINGVPLGYDRGKKADYVEGL